MSLVEDFLTPIEEQEVIAAIQQAEEITSGEIRVHLETELNKDPHERALEVFHLLKMDETKEHNGVLFYVAVKSKNFVIYGDTGINKLVDNSFWESTKDKVINHFKNGDFKTGLVSGILEAGKQLQKYFPIQDNDQNELPNELSIGS